MDYYGLLLADRAGQSTIYDLNCIRPAVGGAWFFSFFFFFFFYFIYIIYIIIFIIIIIYFGQNSIKLILLKESD